MPDEDEEPVDPIVEMEALITCHRCGGTYRAYGWNWTSWVLYATPDGVNPCEGEYYEDAREDLRITDFRCGTCYEDIPDEQGERLLAATGEQ